MPSKSFNRRYFKILVSGYKVYTFYPKFQILIFREERGNSSAIPLPMFMFRHRLLFPPLLRGRVREGVRKSVTSCQHGRPRGGRFRSLRPPVPMRPWPRVYPAKPGNPWSRFRGHTPGGAWLQSRPDGGIF